MKRLFSRTIALFTNRKIWVRQIVVASLAAGAAWLIGEQAFDGGGLVAAIVCSLSIRISCTNLFAKAWARFWVRQLVQVLR